MSSQSFEGHPVSAEPSSSGRMTHQRWVICGLLFLATVIAYVDRGVIAYLKTFLQGVIPGLTDFNYGIITAAFQLAYAIGMVVAGGLTDKLGTRKAFSIAIVLWSVAAMLPGAAFSVITFAISRQPSKQLPNGFRKKNARRQQGFSTLVRTWATSLCR